MYALEAEGIQVVGNNIQTIAYAIGEKVRALCVGIAAAYSMRQAADIILGQLTKG